MLLYLSLLAIPIFLFLIQKWFNNRGQNIPPGPQGLPLIGNLHQLDKSLPLYRQFCQLSQKYGPLVYLQLGFVPTLIVSSAKMAKEVLKTHDAAFSDRPNLVGWRKLSYNGLDIALSSINDYSRELRKICNAHLFSPKKAQYFGHVREEQVRSMLEKINKYATNSKPVNLSEMMTYLTSTIICRIAFGKACYDELLDISMFCKLLSEAQAVYGGFYFSDYFPYAAWIDRLTGQIARRDKSFNELDGFVEKVIREHIEDKKDKFGQEDIVDVLLRIQKDNSSTIKLSLDGIKALIFVDIFSAGTETNASVLIWAMSELLKNPKALKSLQKEIRVLHENKSFLCEDDTRNIPYLQAVVKETMRLHPPAPLLIPHKSTEICNLNGYIIRPNTLVYINAWAIGRDPESWDNPEEFLPERFLGSSIDFRGQDFELIPFGAGRRSCPGMLMGIATIELTLANLVYLFDWNLPNGINENDIDMDVKPGMVVHKKDIFIAGTDTSASALVWAMTELVKNPKSMKRLQKEIRDVNQKKKFSTKMIFKIPLICKQ